MTGQKRPLELYLHIPFCVQKCAYCDFLSFPSTVEQREQYVHALEREISAYGFLTKGDQVQTVFFGGGTPSVLSAAQFQSLMAAIKTTFAVDARAEITVECNPGTLTEEKLLAYKEAGVNRLSIGLQSVNDEELALLGRIHTFQEFRENYQLARAVGFANINVDLISAIPGQTSESWKRTLDMVLGLKAPPEHLSVYSLILEEGTPFYDRFQEGQAPLPGEEEERKIYHLTGELLEKAGYQRYEISNYARAGYVCRHNVGYWRRKEYLGLGLGASGFMASCRYHNTRNFEKYVTQASEPARIRQEEHYIDEQAAMEEFMFLGLRMMEGVSGAEFKRHFGREIKEIYGNKLDLLINKGLIISNNNNYRLTDRGIDVSNLVVGEFLL